MEAQLKTLEQRLEDQNSKIEHKFEEMMKMMQAIQAEKVSTPISEPSTPSSASNDSFTRSNPTRTLGMNPKLEFPKFNGNNPRIWAESWMMNYLSVRRSVIVDWNDFVVDLYARFRDNSTLDAVEQFNKLQQIGSIEEYIDEFENLRSILMMNNHILPDSYLLDSFVGGLKPAVKPFVRAFKPSTIASAIDFARLQEENLTTSAQVFKQNKYSSATAINTRPFKHIPVDVGQEKIAKGLCYYCDQPYNREHKCAFKEPQLFTVEIPGCGFSLEEECEVLESDGEFDPQISVHALAGSNSFQTMRVKGVVNGKDLHILIDSGSTHNFVDMSIAAKLGCHLEQIPFQSVSVAVVTEPYSVSREGVQVCSTLVDCAEFSELMQKYTEVFAEPSELPPSRGVFDHSIPLMPGRAVLMQEGHPLAYISSSLGTKWQKLSVYDKELLAIVFAVQKWEHYLVGSHFVIKTNQKISTPFQQFWLSKLMGFDYEIQYKCGKENVAADALSRVQESEILFLAISMVDSNLESLITAS
uniref:Ty3 transposon capsid-like protein domain-containing protein n=1 Tax=Chenopodium quinoa TaxID=63459 RepID=A0A803MBH9_CHEQI